MAGIIHILRQDDTASSASSPLPRPRFFSHASRKEGRSLFAKFSPPVFCRPLPDRGEGGEREEDSRRLTLSAQLRANFLFAIFLSARRFVATSVKRNEVEMMPRVENNSD